MMGVKQGDKVGSRVSRHGSLMNLLEIIFV